LANEQKRVITNHVLVRHTESFHFHGKGIIGIYAKFLNNGRTKITLFNNVTASFTIQLIGSKSSGAHLELITTEITQFKMG
jgi:hypothetical protein